MINLLVTGDNIDLIRDSSHIYNFNDQNDTINIACKLIISY